MQYFSGDIMDPQFYRPLEIDSAEFERSLIYTTYAFQYLQLSPDMTKHMLYDFLAKEFDYYNPHVYNFIKNTDSIKLIMKYCPDFEDFQKRVENYAGCPYDETHFENQGYQVISPIKNNLIQLRCKKCHTEFITSVWAINNNIGCPRCIADIPQFDLMSNIVQAYGNDEYKLLDIQGPNLKLQHSCGKESTKRISQFFAHKTYCTCESARHGRKRHIERQPKNLEIPGLEYLGRVDTIRKGRFRCKKCGRTFVRQIENLKDSDSCPLCKKEKNKREATDYLVKDTFTVMRYPSIENNTVKLKCNKCGHVFEEKYVRISREKIERGIGNSMNQYVCPVCMQSEKIYAQDILAVIRSKFEPSSIVSTSELLLIPQLHDLASKYGNNYVYNKIRRLCDTGRLIRINKGVYQIPEKASAEPPWDLHKKIFRIIERDFPESVFSRKDLIRIPEIQEIIFGKGKNYLSYVLTILVKKELIQRVKHGVYVINAQEK